ncbi:chitin-binding protein [Streptomyces mashuensis]|uniref:Chitin-binding protein n=1 Tax=Streptomyces mashuensis TaxID=33904 RepID=A0A919EC01_9ACTN|nr:lytic polysaccharide monooxygenase [Streptomyces mashuensis]GHF36558.1 chitin-binding protein [Streptomyces mashuensis]
MRRKIGAAVIGLSAACLTLVPAGGAAGHGYTDTPTSRQVFCAQGAVTDCGEIQWEPQSVEGPKGFPSHGPSDGTLCAGGNSRFAELDDPRGGAWPATRVAAGQNYTFRWRLTARHATTDFRYYLTNDRYRPDRPLTRADLDLTPFLTVPYNGRIPDATVSHQGRLPAGKTGRQMILAVWTIADTGNAFYACSDVEF